MASKKGALKGLDIGSRKPKASGEDALPVSGSEVDKQIAAERYVNGAETETQKDTVERSKNSVMDIPLDLLDPNELNARTIYKPAVIQERAASLSKEGQIVPLAVVALENGRYKIVDGHYRVKAARVLGLSTLRCEIRDENLSGFELFKISHAANEARTEQTVIDTASVSRYLVEESGVKREVLCEFLGRSEGELSKILRIGLIPIEFLEILSRKETAISIHSGYAIAQIYSEVSDTEVFMSCITKIVENDLNKQDVEKLRADLSKEKPKPKPKSVPRHQFTNADGKIKGSLDLKGTKINMKFNAPSIKVANDISDAIALILEKANGQ
jgi:ParB/RepB/Spo0J family partition protein